MRARARQAVPSREIFQHFIASAQWSGGVGCEVLARGGRPVRDCWCRRSARPLRKRYTVQEASLPCERLRSVLLQAARISEEASQAHGVAQPLVEYVRHRTQRTRALEELESVVQIEFCVLRGVSRA